MPNYIKVTTVDANHIKVEFQDYYTNGVVSEIAAFYNRVDIEEVKVYSNHIRIHVLNNSQDWIISDTEDLDEKILQIDDIDGTTSWASHTVLAAQIAALMKS